jgi:hypothetical protein
MLKEQTRSYLGVRGFAGASIVVEATIIAENQGVV